MHRGELFKGLPFHDFQQGRRNSLIAEIHQYDANAVLHTPIEELAEYFQGRFLIDPIVIKRGEMYADEPKEENVQERVFNPMFGDTVNANNSYISFTLHLPFEGDPNLFGIEPTSRTHSMSQRMDASVVGNEIHLRYRILASENANLEGIYSHDVQILCTNAERLQNDIGGLNSQIPSIINEKINERRTNASKNQTLIQSLKIPIKRRDDVPATYSIPEIQRKPKIVTPPKVKTYTPEPTLDIGEYEYILTIIKDMSLAMERSPATFAKLTEEEIRNFFLILLNGHYKGSATGETFNGKGKTDILIRHQNANAFIAECKFWLGQKKLQEAIEQLLGYVTWRDTKTSIILFNKKNDLTAALEKVRETMEAHKHYRSSFSLASPELKNTETILGYKFTHPSDPDKEIFLTVLAFQITKPL